MCNSMYFSVKPLLDVRDPIYPSLSCKYDALPYYLIPHFLFKIGYNLDHQLNEHFRSVLQTIHF